MDELVLNFVKFLSSTVVFRIISYPNFAIEILLATVVCVSQALLIFEINTLVRRTKAKTKLRMKHPIKEAESISFHSLVAMKTSTRAFHDKPDIYHIYSSIKPKKRFDGKDRNFGWAVSTGDSVMRHTFSDRVEYLLSTTPSEYVRCDLARKSREQSLRSCLQSLKFLLEKALNNDEDDSINVSKTQNSVNTPNEGFELELTNDYAQINKFASSSLQSPMEQKAPNHFLKSPLDPEKLMSWMYQCSNVNISKSNSDMRPKTKTHNEEDDGKDVGRCLALKSSESLSEIYRKKRTTSGL
ncbi:uncharacterized protein [Euwallacea fornicatus]|uniref:uncharacterized protein n=1 Tax=Euwallacea fornicatus TaxID=995702 RepID=UPI0033902459